MTMYVLLDAAHSLGQHYIR